jgi:predicted RNA binding protein YcfA (HicA-like mRNA interferase family)
MHSREVIRAVERDGWRRVRVSGDHYIFRHASKPGLVIVPHPVADIPIGTLRSIERQSGVILRQRR